ncbi:hypothetical protein KUTeg_015783 [Tegillarca granosa]|uniref:C1q domain-containing protein n=1 Tax=Tegillarca granosa TaxID=220873 RepID=A0ABQ9ENA1_TEGGR|nr:hypothetical protein KUTeg_015783 [Tegillarca granosa]
MFANYFVFLVLFKTFLYVFGDPTISERQIKRSDGLVHDVVQQMVAEQIERKQILKVFGEMKKYLSDVKRELKERNTIMRDTKFLQRKLIRDIEEMKKEVKEISKFEVKKAINDVNQRITSVTKKLQKSVKNQVRSLNEKIKRTDVSTKKDVRDTRKEIDKMEKTNAKLFMTLQNKIKVLKNETSINYQVAFTAKLNDDPTTSSTIIFKTVITNIGGGYNNRDGIFYCPKAGLYMFTTSLMSIQKYSVDGYIMNNNKHTVRLFEHIGSSNNYYPSASTTVMLRLAIGDKVWVKGAGIKYHGKISTFSGILPTTFELLI